MPFMKINDRNTILCTLDGVHLLVKINEVSY